MMFRKLMLSAALCAALTTYAGAVDLTTPITQFNGKPLTDAQGNPSPRTLGSLLEDTLLITTADVTAADKNKRFWMALKIHDKSEVTFTPEELVTLKEVLGKYQSILIAGQAIRILDPTATPKE